MVEHGLRFYAFNSPPTNDAICAILTRISASEVRDLALDILEVESVSDDDDDDDGDDDGGDDDAHLPWMMPHTQRIPVA